MEGRCRSDEGAMEWRCRGHQGTKIYIIVKGPRRGDIIAPWDKRTYHLFFRRGDKGAIKDHLIAS